MAAQSRGSVKVFVQAEQAMQHGGQQGMQMSNMVEVAPGETGELVHTCDKDGEVLIGCHQPGHYVAGMKATVSVST